MTISRSLAPLHHALVTKYRSGINVIKKTIKNHIEL